MVSLRAALSSTSILFALFAYPALADLPISPSFAYGSSKVRGVNLGGWLVLEVSTVLHVRAPLPPYPTVRTPALREAELRVASSHGHSAPQPWITPSIFDNTGNNAIVDEWTFGQFQDPSEAQSVLKQHWDTWITEQDFIDIAAAG